LKKAERVYDAAYEAKPYNAAMSAIKETGVLWGKRVERSEADQPGMMDNACRNFLNQKVDPRPVSNEESRSTPPGSINPSIDLDRDVIFYGKFS